MQTVTIPKELYDRIRDVLEDVTGLVECNCCIQCDGTCTYSMAVAALADLEQAKP
jgi:hypothetical protein